MRHRMDVSRSCCGDEVIELDATTVYLDFQDVEDGTGTTVPEAGLSGGVHLQLNTYRGVGFVLPVGDVPESLTSASLDFSGYMLFGAGAFEPEITLKIHAVKYSLPFDYGDVAASSLTNHRPLPPSWGFLTQLRMSTPDISTMVNQITSDAGFNMATDQVMIVFRCTYVEPGTSWTRNIVNITTEDTKPVFNGSTL